MGAGGGVLPQARRAGWLPVRPLQEARAPRRRQLQRHQLRAGGDRQRRRLHEAPPRRKLRLPRGIHPRAHRGAGRRRPVEVADEGEPAGRNALAGGRVRRRRLAGVPLLRTRRAEAGRERRRGGRLQRGALPRGFRPERQDPRRRDQRDHRPAARPRREAPRHRGHLPQRHHPRPPLPLPPLPDRLLAVGEPQPPAGLGQGHQRRPRHLHQRLQRRPEIRRQQRILVGADGVDRGHDVQFHQGGRVGARDDVRAAARRDAGDDPGGATGERRPATSPPPPRLLGPQDDPIRRRAGAAALLVRGVRHLPEAVSPVTSCIFPPRIRFYRALQFCFDLL